MPETLLMFMILPHFERSIRAAVLRIMLNAPLRFTAMTLSKSSSFMNAISPSFVMPALFTRISTEPKSFLISCTVAFASSPEETSHL